MNTATDTSSRHADIQRLGDLSFDSVFIYDLKARRFIYLNESLGGLVNLGKDRLMQKPELIIPYINSEDKEYVGHQYSELLFNHSLKDVEFRIEMPDGSIKHLCCDAFHFEEEDTITGFVKDVTKVKEHEDYIINYGAKKDTLLDMMTHNLSGPLNLSKNILRWMQQANNDSTKEIGGHLQLMQDSTEECLNIVNDFLKEEHLASEHIYVKKTRFDVLKRIMSTLDKLILTNSNKKFRIITDLENLNITTDSVKFFQIIHNLVSNSIKFTPEDGQIDILVEETEKSFIIRVRDNGIGIPAKLHPHLFDTRNLSGRKGLKDETSNGIGLSIVKKLVELLDGKLYFETEENHGTVFSVELPKD